jgi:hypothetical protein
VPPLSCGLRLYSVSPNLIPKATSLYQRVGWEQHCRLSRMYCTSLHGKGTGRKRSSIEINLDRLKTDPYVPNLQIHMFRICNEEFTLAIFVETSISVCLRHTLRKRLKHLVPRYSCKLGNMNLYNYNISFNKENRPDDGGSKDLRNVGKLLPGYTVLQPRRQPSSYSPLWKLQILQSRKSSTHLKTDIHRLHNAGMFRMLMAKAN